MINTHVTTAVATKDIYSTNLTTLLSQVDIEALKQALAQSCNSTTTSSLSITPGTSSSWFFDSGCCNHMTADSQLLKHKKIFSHPHTIHNAENS